MNFNKGILSIQDPRGRYVGMQNIANDFLTGRNIDISTQGPKEDPTAVVVEVSAEEDKFIKEEDKTYTRIKGDYKKHANPNMFSVLLNNAITSFDMDKKHNRGNTYRISDNSGNKVQITPEEFYTDTYDFSTKK